MSENKSPDQSVESERIFSKVSFYLDDNIDESIKKLLKNGGAQREFYISDLVTHVITDTCNFQQMQQVKDLKLNIVNSDWVVLSTKCGAVLPVEPFSPEKNRLFSDVVVCPSQIPKGDRDSIWAMVTFYGGACQVNLTPKCTHLVIGKATGRKFEFAQENPSKIKMVTPEWVIDSIKQQKCLDEALYCPEMPTTNQIPSPTNLSNQPPTPTTPNQTSMFSAAVTKHHLNNSTGNLLKLESPVVDIHPPPVNGKKVEIVDDTPLKLISSDRNGSSLPLPLINTEELNQNLKSDVINFGEGDLCLANHVLSFADYKERMPSETYDVWLEVVKKHGGVVEEKYSSKCTHLICLHQHNDEYRQALKDGKKIATAHWLNDVLTKKHVVAPYSPLHFPVPFSDVIPACRSLLITVSGFSGLERTILKNIIFILGAQYTGYMCKSHTHLVCKDACGDKYVRAKDWGIPVVNASWLRDIVQSGLMQPLNPDSKYFNLLTGNEFNVNTEFCKHMMDPWKKPLLYAEPSIISPVAPSIPMMTKKPTEKVLQSTPIEEKSLISPPEQKEAPPVEVPVKQSPVEKETKAIDKEASGNEKEDHTTEKEADNEDQPMEESTKELRNETEIENKNEKEMLHPEIVDKDKITISSEKRKSPERLMENLDEPDSKKTKLETVVQPTSPAPLLSATVPVVNSTLEKAAGITSEPIIAEKELPRVLFTGLTGPVVQKMSQCLKKLKGEIAKNVRSCTHLVAPKITRTVKFLSAISICKHIVAPAWVEESFKAGKFLDETLFRLKDPESEHIFGFQLQASLERAQKKRVFQGLKFVVTPRIVPQPSQMREIIECAGGEIAQISNGEELIKHVGDLSETKGTIFVISCDEDRSIWEKSVHKDLDVYSVELVLSGVMKQDVECDSHRF